MSDDFISQEDLLRIKEECALWANNCGGCETCERFFGKPPVYDHQETYYLICMIEERDKRIKELEMNWIEKISCIFERFLSNFKRKLLEREKND